MQMPRQRGLGRVLNVSRPSRSPRRLGSQEFFNRQVLLPSLCVGGNRKIFMGRSITAAFCGQPNSGAYCARVYARLCVRVCLRVCVWAFDFVTRLSAFR